MDESDVEAGEGEMTEFVIDGSVNSLAKGEGEAGKEGGLEKYVSVEVEDDLLKDLRPEQARAVALLVAGRPLNEIAREVGVHRTTLHKWMKRSAGFTAAYNQWHQHMRDTAHSRLMMMADKAADAMEKALEAGDGRLALRYFEKMGLAREREVGAIDAETVRREREMERKQKVLKRKEAEFHVEMQEMTLGRVGREER